MSHYSGGREVEYRVRDDLAAHDWLVFRMAGSKGPADLIAVGRSKAVAFVNVKRSGVCPPRERHNLIALADRLGHAGLPVVASKPPRRPLAYRLLTGPGPKDWMPWEPAQGEAA